MTLEQPEQAPQFDPDFVKATVESLVRYMQSLGVKQYEFKICGWQIKMKAVENEK